MADEIAAPAPAPAAAPAPVSAPGPDVNALLAQVAQLQQRVSNSEQILQAAAMQAQLGPQGEQSAPAAAPMSEPGFGDVYDPAQVDRLVESKLSAREQKFYQQLQSMQDRVDYNGFRAEVAEAGYSQDVVDSAEKLFQTWKMKGVRLNNGEMLSRNDALTFVLGQQGKQTAIRSRSERVSAEAQRRAENSDAFVEAGGRRAAAGLPDPTKMSREDRRRNYWPALLDKEGF